MASPAKRSKSSVDYSLGGDHCGACTHWIESAENEATETGACELVEGPINEDYWCNLFKRKPRKSQESRSMAGMSRYVRGGS